ncbi:MAG: peptidylprolyl isomerase [Rhodospirillaceae bacterium]|nr:peptidylprolyl isomerase [Rhodospirillaceae bacterium]MBT7614217.1 peptidylprolyl isomerase [Rhodospirillaceae bacterium]
MMDQLIELIVVNGAPIAAEAIAAEAQNHPTEDPKAALEEAARALVIRELLLEKAQELELVAKPADLGHGKRESDEEALVRTLLEREVNIPEADEAACRRFYAGHGAHFKTPELFEAAHILIAADANDSEAFGCAVAQAEALIRELQQTPDRFAELARHHSDCSSAKDGGSLGQVERGQTTPEFETFLVTLDEGQLCPVPVPTHYGAHILRLDRRVSGRTLPFEEVADLIAHYLQEASFRRGVAQYIRLLAGEADIRGIELDAVDSPLVQ